MIIMRIVRGMGAVALIAASGCHSLDVQNPNEPDAQRALSDPNAIEAVAGGALRTWFNAYTSLRGAGVLATQAKNYTSSWNNGNLNFYTSIDNPTDSPDKWNRMSRVWQNDPAAAARTSIDAFWGGGLDESSVVRGGFYAALSASNTALIDIRKNKFVIRNTSDTKWIETIGAFVQGASLLIYAC